MSDAFVEVVQGPLDGLGRALVDFVVRRTRRQQADKPTAVYAALVRASDRPVVREHLQEAIDQMIVAPLAPRLMGEDAELRAHLLAAQLSGLMAARSTSWRARGCEQRRSRRHRRTYGAALQVLVDR